LPVRFRQVAAPSVFSLDLDLDLFSGPFDLLLTLVLRDEVDLAEVPVAEICVEYLERVAEESELDLEAASEFLVLVAALVELKSRLLLPDEEVAGDEHVDDAADELAARLAEYARIRAAAEWLGARRAAEGRRVFRSVRAPLAPPRTADRPMPGEDAARLAAAIEGLLAPPPAVDISHLPKRLLPVGSFLQRFRRLLVERGTFTFDDAVGGLDRMAVAVAFWALLDLYKRGEVRMVQAEPFAPIRIARAAGLLVTPDDARAAASDDDEAEEEAVA
jgi:segregation and condensation protein A